MNDPGIPFRIEATGRVPYPDPPGRRLVAFVTWLGEGGPMFIDPSIAPGVHRYDAFDGFMRGVIEPRARALNERREEAARQQEGRLL